ncbi:MAG TPA: glycoside hydrolase domain-containing protein [Bryobacteraceae bacterium]|nr:glycoside hydrolase domain-containing protein [Bryobacteraceae bacterium]
MPIGAVVRFWVGLSVLIASPPALHNGMYVWVVSSLERIGQASAPGAETAVSLQAARGETESFQIGIRAPEGVTLTGVEVSVSDLSAGSRRSIPASSVSLFRERYVEVRRGSPDRLGSNRPLGPGRYPDALIPFKDPQTGAPWGHGLASPFEVEEGTNQVIWVDVSVPRSAMAGRYQGAYTVRSDQGVFRGGVELEVWDFTLPPKPALRTSFLVWSADSLPVIQELLRNKLNPAKSPPAQQRALTDDFGLASADLGLWSGADIGNCIMPNPPPLSQIKKVLAAHAPDLYLYNYSADEIDRCQNLVEPLKRWGRALREAGIRQLVTMAPTPALLDDGSGAGRSAVDIWVMLPVVYDRALQTVLQAQKKGDEIWSYNALVQDSYSPKWLIDFDPINFRIQPGFISQSLNLTGLLYWRVDLWGPDPWSVVNTGQFQQYPGEGMLVYPGAPLGAHGVAPSMRLKWLRDGVEDYDYMQLLKEAGHGKQAMEIAARVGKNWSSWTHDPQALQNARREAGEILSRASRDRKLGVTPRREPVSPR